jgi:hypothetical protein
VLKLDQSKDLAPNCFGQQFDRNAPECVGGHDPAFRDEEGGHVRPACEMVSSCSVRTTAQRQNPQLIPAANIVRPPTTFNQPQARPMYQPPLAGASVVQPYRPQAAYAPPYAQQAQLQQQMQHVGLQQMIPVNYGMPQYLTVREPVNGQKLFTRLGVEVLRSMGKSFGHTLSNFFDTEIFGRRE